MSLNDIGDAIIEKDCVDENVNQDISEEESSEDRQIIGEPIHESSSTENVQDINIQQSIRGAKDDVPATENIDSSRTDTTVQEQLSHSYDPAHRRAKFGTRLRKEIDESNILTSTCKKNL